MVLVHEELLLYNARSWIMRGRWQCIGVAPSLKRCEACEEVSSKNLRNSFSLDLYCMITKSKCNIFLSWKCCHSKKNCTSATNLLGPPREGQLWASTPQLSWPRPWRGLSGGHFSRSAFYIFPLENHNTVRLVNEVQWNFDNDEWSLSTWNHRL
jgi:hypothetical protein